MTSDFAQVFRSVEEHKFIGSMTQVAQSVVNKRLRAKSSIKIIGSGSLSIVIRSSSVGRSERVAAMISPCTREALCTVVSLTWSSTAFHLPETST
jgi:nucleoid DNA-binding protein